MGRRKVLEEEEEVQMGKEEGLRGKGGRTNGERKEERIGKEEGLRRRGGSANGEGGRTKGARRKD